MSAAGPMTDQGERIALDIHAHLAPVLKDRLGVIAGVSWNDTEGTMTIDGYTLAAKSVYRPEALIAWIMGNAVESSIMPCCWSTQM